MTKKALEATETYAEDVKKNFHATLDWLHEHACSRSYGLGEYYMGRVAEKPVVEVLTKWYSNQPAQLQRQARKSKFHL